MISYNKFTSCAGHSERSPGAEANGLKEHEQARLCNDAFIRTMKAHGHAVANTTSDAANKVAVLQEQVAKANKSGGGKNDLAISFHLNSGGGTGVEVYHYDEGTQVVASAISSAIATALGVRNRGAKQSKELYFLKHTTAPAILIEVCFLDSMFDMQRLMKKRKEMAAAVAEVLIGPFFSSTDLSPPSTPKSSYKGSSIVDYLKSIDIDPTFSNRARLAVSYKVVKSPAHYHGTVAQNSQLLAAMREREVSK